MSGGRIFHIRFSLLLLLVDTRVDAKKVVERMTTMIHRFHMYWFFSLNKYIDSTEMSFKTVILSGERGKEGKKENE